MTLSPFILTSFFICSENLLFNTSNFKSNNWKMWNCFSRNIFFLVGHTIFREWISKFVKILCLVPDRDSWEFSNVTYQFLAIKVPLFKSIIWQLVPSILSPIFVGKVTVVITLGIVQCATLLTVDSYKAAIDSFLTFAILRIYSMHLRHEVMRHTF